MKRYDLMDKLVQFWGFCESYSIDKYGISFPRNGGDQIIWLFPWRRQGRGRFISVLASGTGEFGDCHFHSLKELDEYWKDYEAWSRLDMTPEAWDKHLDFKETDF